MSQERRAGSTSQPVGLANLERTRQQIQELDQLLQQMLALPLAEERSAESVPPGESPSASGSACADPSVSKTSPGSASEAWNRVPPAMSDPFSQPLPSPGVEAESVTDDTSALEAVELAEARSEQGPADEPIWASPGAPAVAERRQRSTLSYQAAVRVNSGLERMLLSLGPLGRPFLSDWGREWLGWLGLVLLVAAAALTLGMWLGWNW
jgi:hypothetical protein